jgi:hypothetical protein
MEISSGIAPTLTVGGRVMTDTANLIILCAEISGNNSTFRKPNSSTGYSTPAGKTLNILAMRISTTAAGAQGVNLCYGDTDLGWSVVANPVTPVYYGGAIAPNYHFGGGSVSGPAMEHPVGFLVPTGKFPTAIGSGATGYMIFLFGYEV